MKKIIMIACVVFGLNSLQSNAQVRGKSVDAGDKMVSIYDFKVKDIDGKEFDFKKLEGKKILIVNTASECGFTPQYEELETLYTKFGNDNFVIIGFPANNFKNQEPGTNAEIKMFCSKKFGVTFPMMEKVSVSGKDMCELYQFLTQKSKNGVMDSEVKWNFQKYLINEKGLLIQTYPSKVSPMDEEIVNWITSK